MNPRRIYPFSHSPIDCYFKPSIRDFVVKELPLYESSGSGEHLMLLVRKKNLDTFSMLKILSNALNIRLRDIGYAGLKDKFATTYQYISLHKSLESKLDSLTSYLQEQNIKIIQKNYHNNKLKIGHLKGNSFFVRLKKINNSNAIKLDSVLRNIANSGFPNFFGKQRFGRDGDNFAQGEQIAKQNLKIRNKKISNFLLSSYQSALFNQWLSCRNQLSIFVNDFDVKSCLEACKMHEFLQNLAFSKDEVQNLKAQPQLFKILHGDIAMHYPFGKVFEVENLLAESKRFLQQEISITGLLSGKKALLSKEKAFKLESAFLQDINALGTRRYAWVWVQDLQSEYKAQEAHFELSFTLPKGSYATIFLEALLARELNDL